MLNKNNFKYYLPVFFAVVFTVGMFLGALLNSYNKSKDDISNESIFNFGLKKYDKINDVINNIIESYVDSIDKDKLIDDAIIGLLSKLDPHSSYIPADEFKEMNEVLLGNFEGIGVEFRIEHDTVFVVNTISGGPSEKIGIKAGDRIVKVNDTLIAGVGITNQEVIKKLKGPKNTEVKVTIYRKSVADFIDFIIVRDVIPTYSLDIAYMVDKEIGYIKLNRFGATTYDEFIEAINNLKFKGMKKLILDLRGNGGGYLNAAINIADEFLNKKQLIVYTEGLKRAKKSEYASARYSMKDISFAILIDEWSASASEVLAGALQDNDKGVVIGRRSFGKGLVQEQIELADGSALRLTVARYYTPTGRSIQRPYSEDSEAYYIDFYKRLLEENDIEFEKDSIEKDTLKFYTPKGKLVYGGGGITPDIIIDYDSEKYSKFFNELSNKGLIYEFAFDYADNNRDVIKKRYKTAKDFNKNFNIDDSLYNEFLLYVQKNGVSQDKNEKAFTHHLIKARIKAFIGRNLFNNEAFFPNLNTFDDIFQKAFQVLKNDTLYNTYHDLN